MSVRYINDRFLPDKAIDIIDEASAKVRLGECRRLPRAEELEKEIQKLLEQKECAIQEADLDRARAIQKEQTE